MPYMKGLSTVFPTTHKYSTSKYEVGPTRSSPFCHLKKSFKVQQLPKALDALP